MVRIPRGYRAFVCEYRAFGYCKTEADAACLSGAIFADAVKGTK